MARKVHMILGLSAGILLVISGATGTILAFRDEIDRVLNPSLWRVEAVTKRASLERIRAAAEATGGPPARMLLIPDRDDLALMVLLVGRAPSDRWEVFIDPHTARVLGRRRFGSGWTEKVKRLHTELFAGKNGRLVVGVGGLLWLVIGITGAILWWKTRSPGWQGGAFGWHRRVGILSLVPSLVLATSGAFLIFRPYLAPALNLLTGPMPLEKAVQSRGDSSREPPSLDQIRDRAVRYDPDGRVTRVYLPQGPSGTFAVRMRMPEDENPHGNTALRFDRLSGELLQRHSSRGTTRVQKLAWYAAYPWHTGDSLGMIGKILVAATGLLPIALFATGLRLWARRLHQGETGAISRSGPSRTLDQPPRDTRHANR